MEDNIFSLKPSENTYLQYFLERSPKKVLERNLKSKDFKRKDLDGIIAKGYITKKEIYKGICPECGEDMRLTPSIGRAYCNSCEKEILRDEVDFYEYYLSDSFSKTLTNSIRWLLSKYKWECLDINSEDRDRFPELLVKAKKDGLNCCFALFTIKFTYRDYLSLKGLLDSENILFGFVLASSFDNLSTAQIMQSSRIFDINLVDMKDKISKVLTKPENYLKFIKLIDILKREYELYDVDKELLSVTENIDNLFFETQALAKQDRRLLGLYGGLQKATKKFETNIACLLKLALRVYPLGGPNQPDGLICFDIKGRYIGWIYDCKTCSAEKYVVLKADYQDMITNIGIRHNRDIQNFVDIHGCIFISHSFDQKNMRTVSQKIEIETGIKCLFLPNEAIIELAKGAITNLVNSPNKPDYEESIYKILFTGSHREITKQIVQNALKGAMLTDKKSRYIKDAFRVK